MIIGVCTGIELDFWDGKFECLRVDLKDGFVFVGENWHRAIILLPLAYCEIVMSVIVFNTQ